jgi:hypothetical protein
MTLSSLSVWSMLLGALVPASCTASECDGPGGLCIDTPSGDNGEPGGAPTGEPGGEPGTAGAPVDGGAGGSSGSAGSGEEGGAPQAGEGGEAGSSGRGGTSSSGGSRSSGGTGGTSGSGATSDGGESDGGAGSSGEGNGGTVVRGGMGGALGGFGGAAGAPGGRAGKGGTGPAGGTGPTGGFAGDVLCAPPDSFTDTCDGTAGAGGDDGSRFCDPGTSASTSGEVELGAGGMGPGITLYPIDNLDDGDVLSDGIFGGRGIWYAANDGSGLQFPTACPGSAAVGMFPVPGGRAFHTFGSGFTLPNGFVNIGLSFRSSPPACDMPINASVAHGVRFRAKGTVVSQMVRMSISTTATNPVEDGGTCTVGCYDGFGSFVTLLPDFQEYRVYFTDVVQEGWGTPAAFDPSRILNIQWAGQRPCFDFWIDDIAFFRID